MGSLDGIQWDSVGNFEKFPVVVSGAVGFGSEGEEPQLLTPSESGGFKVVAAGVFQ